MRADHRAYLLGQSADVPELGAAWELAESTLIDDYVLGALSPAEVRAFEAHYLTTPERRAQVDLARRIFQAPPKASHWRWAALGIALVMLMGFVWFLRREPAPALLVLTETAHRGPGAPLFHLRGAGPVVTLQMEGVSGPVTARLQRIGMAQPLMELHFQRPKASSLAIPLPTGALEPGDYSLTLDPGPTYVFQVIP